MKALGDTLLALATQFAILSLLAFGGVNPVIPEIHRLAVHTHHWMDDKTFAALFAISQAAPGPNFMISTLVGLKAAGWPGAIIATVALCAPSGLLAYWTAKLWDYHRHSPWRAAIAAGLAPVTVGLVTSTAWLLTRAADLTPALAMATIATGAVAYFTKLNPLWCFASAAGLGWLGMFG